MSAEQTHLGQEREEVLGLLSAVVATLGSVVGRNIEVALHDLTRPESSIVQIANGHVTGRTVGSPILAGPEQDKAFSAIVGQGDGWMGPRYHVIPSYQTTRGNGEVLRSASLVIRDSEGTPFAGFCINIDNRDLVAARDAIDRIMDVVPQTSIGPPEPQDMELLMKEIIRSSLREHGFPSKTQKKRTNLAAVRAMHERGMFIVRGGVEKAAEALGVTRFTIYNYLDEIRKQTETAGRQEEPPRSRGKP